MAAACPGLDVVCGAERHAGQHVHLATGGSHRAYLAARRELAGALWGLHARLRPFNRLKLSLERQMFRDPGLLKVRVMSRRGAAELANLYNLPPGKLAVIPHGVDAARFDLARRPTCRSVVRSRHGLAENEALAVMVGSGFERKGLGCCLRAMRLLREGGGKAPALVVIGTGGEPAHRRLAQRLGVGAVFAGVTERVADYLLAADLFVLPSVYEPFGLAVLEAMAAGLPVIVSAACGASELVEEGVSGYVLEDAADAAALARRIQMLSEPTLRERLGRRARETALEWTPERDYKATCDLLAEVARQRQAGPAAKIGA
jgi:UDP-glucose:(heptosyl)LPS alpha-1,3-glucosyltransferase